MNNAYDKGRAAAFARFKLGGAPLVNGPASGGAMSANASAPVPAARTSMAPTASAAAPIAMGAPKAHALG